MATTLNDNYLLSTAAVFQNRVQASLIAACVAIANEGYGVAFHRERATFGVQVLASPLSPTNWVQLFANAVATDANCISDATQAGTVSLTTTNLATQAALVTDAHINTAVASVFNSFIREPSN